MASDATHPSEQHDSPKDVVSESRLDHSFDGSTGAPLSDNAFGTPLQRHVSKDSVASVETAILSPSLSFLGLEDVGNQPKHSHDPTKTKLRVKPSDHAKLQLSGRIISVVFCLPHMLTFTHGEAEPWAFKHRAGTAALFESFKYLSIPQTPWKHYLVGWTGEIVHRRARKDMTRQMYLLETYPIHNKLSAPVPVDGGPLHPPIHDPNLNIMREDRAKLEQKLMGDSGMNMVPVWFTDEVDDDGEVFTFKDQDKWRNFTEKELYQLFHYKLPELVGGKEKTKRWNDYVSLNRKFADKILECYTPGDTVMVHDYHLMLVPSMLRARVGDIKVTFILHTPFPSYEYFRCLPHRNEIMDGILGADTIIFQSHNFADHFQKCCKQLPGKFRASTSGIETPGKRSVLLEVLPLGLDNDAIWKYAFEDPMVKQKCARFVQSMYNADKALILGRDRIDSTRGVLQKLQAFAMFLSLHPQWRGKVVLLQIMSPPNVEDKERGGTANLATVLSVSESINGKFGNFGYKPVRLITEAPSKETYFALLQVADMGLVTSIREGMNTFALEFALTQRDKHRPLLISEFSGSTHTLPGAISINPFDLQATANTINRALTMGPVARGRMYDSINHALSHNSLPKYTHKLLRRIYIHMEQQKASEYRPQLELGVIQAFSKGASRRLFIFDYDGTLTPIVDDPNSALPSDELLDNLENLAADERNGVWIISGRDQDFLNEHLGHIKQLGFSAEHGCFMRYPGTDEWRNMTTKQNMGWQPIVNDAFQKVSDSMPGSLVEQKRVGITWHYRRATNPIAAVYAKSLKKRLLRSVAITYDIEVMAGKANLEVRPKTINKGQVVRRLLKEYGSGPEKEPDFVLCVGDDTTDEDMFRSLRRSDLPMTNVFGVLVGSGTKTTMASWRLQEPSDVVHLIGVLNEVNKDSMPAHKALPAPSIVPSHLRQPWYQTNLV